MKPQEQFRLLRSKNVRRCETRYRPLKSWSPEIWADKLLGEAKEALEAAVRFEQAGAAGSLEELMVLRTELAHELADVIAYADLLAARCDIDLWQAYCEKFNIVSDRVGSKVRMP